VSHLEVVFALCGAGDVGEFPCPSRTHQGDPDFVLSDWTGSHLGSVLYVCRLCSLGGMGAEWWGDVSAEYSSAHVYVPVPMLLPYAQFSLLLLLLLLRLFLPLLLLPLFLLLPPPLPVLRLLLLPSSLLCLDEQDWVVPMCLILLSLCPGDAVQVAMLCCVYVRT